MVSVKQLETHEEDVAVDRASTLRRASGEVSMSDEKRAPKKGLLVKMSQTLHTDLKILATKQNTDMTTIVVELIKKFIADSDGKASK